MMSVIYSFAYVIVNRNITRTNFKDRQFWVEIQLVCYACFLRHCQSHSQISIFIILYNTMSIG